MSVRDNSYGIADLQDKMLDILKYFDTLCVKNNLRYWAGAGTCLGAIRHQGFIPWDDDLDVYMPRTDYEKLWTNWSGYSNDPNYSLCRTTEKVNYRHRVMQIVDKRTTFINERCKNDDIEHGVYIDIIPMDVAPTNHFKRLSQIINTVVFSVYNIQVEPEFHGNGMMEIGTRLMLKMVKSPKARFRKWSKAEKGMVAKETSKTSQYVDLLTYFKMIFKPLPKEWFETTRVPFEDTTVNVPVECDKYLKAFYGDYMQLPPEEKRAVQHHTEFIDLDNSYTKYRGIYYCVNEGEKHA